MNELALFAGAGGGLLGSRLLGWRTVCAVEIEPYCREVLLRRQRDGVLDVFPIWDDVRTFDGKPWGGIVDVVTAGFPCQPFSTAGKRQGADDGRNLWPDTIRVIGEVRPRWCLLENVPGLLSVLGPDGRPYFGRILRDLAESGFDVRWRCLSAAECGAPHRRDRVWIMAHAQCAKWRAGSSQGCDLERVHGLRQEDGQENPGGPGTCCEGVANAEVQPERAGLRAGESPGQRRGRSGNSGVTGDMANPDGGKHGTEQPQSDQRTIPQGNKGQGSWWTAEPGLGRVADGVAHQVDRLRALGNGQIPAVVAAAWMLLNDFGGNA